MGNQWHIEVENEDFYIDLLFYHLKLRCFVVIDLKTGDFKPEYAGKLNFYISAVDDLMKTEKDNPTIGLLLCRNKRGMIAEYSLRDIEKPIGVSEYKLFKNLPKEYENILPSAEDIERRIGEIPLALTLPAKRQATNVIKSLKRHKKRKSVVHNIYD